MIGEVIGNFKIGKCLGSGGMGEVYLAEQQKIGTKVAIKLLRSELSTDTAHVDRFFNEALAVSRIRHAGIVKIFDVGHHETTRRAYLIMELLEGESVSARLARVGRLPLGQLCELGRQCASILDATHAENVTHRDLKPDNIFLVRDAELASRERAKILDFGIAKLSGTMVKSPKTVGMMGTPGYMAPEQWGDSSKVDWRADTYSLGCVLFEMACGRQPFIAHTIPEAYTKHLNEPPPRPSGLVPELPPAFEALLLRMLAKQPAERPPMSEVMAQLEAIGRGHPFAPTATPAGGIPIVAPPSQVPPTLAADAIEVATPQPLVPSTPPASNVAPTVAPDAAPALRSDATPPPGRSDATPAPKVAAAATAANTTLGSSTGETRSTPASKKPIAIGAAVLGAGGIAAVVYVATRGDSTPATTEPPKPPTIDAAVVVAADAADEAPRSLRERIERSNPFVDSRGVKLQTHQVTALEYRWYLESLAAGDAVLQQPVSAWDPAAADARPVRWVTFERARRFCEAIDATLPSDVVWMRAAGDHWGLDPAGTGVIGPLEEWTSIVHDGFATVRGAHAQMSAEDQLLAKEAPMLKPTEALVGTIDPAKPDPKLVAQVASAVIGFRCAR